LRCDFQANGNFGPGSRWHFRLLPGIEGLPNAGKTIEKALANSREAGALYVETMKPSERRRLRPAEVGKSKRKTILATTLGVAYPQR
jgi:predicted RNase H-like HicB family nuclease